ncbi:type II toxin-antitoxin system VapC family toxin [Methylomarinum vadi]|uniref:type II toxin-antitoxin system VapC family toxin n=1 Tax=Methylomarinum vadi TaxID=438855 RepID=UPI0004DEEA86|nr:type II toxin-antitoxin system VapC family toxin [Methylomarinum vadi]
MNGIKFLTDTNILIGLTKGHAPAVDRLRGIALSDCAYSSITRMELLGFPGITELEEQVINSLLKQMTHIGIDTTIEDATIELRKQHRMKLPDAIIAATALTYRLELLTLDKTLGNKM